MSRWPARTALAGLVWSLSAVAVWADHISWRQDVKLAMYLIAYRTEVLLLIAISALLVSYGKRREVAQGAGAFLAGLLAGYPVLFLAQADLYWVVMGLIVAFGAVVAVQPKLPARAWYPALFIAALSLPSLIVRGLPFEQSTWPFLAGLLGTKAALFLISLATCLLIQTQRRHQWVAVVMRVLGSWSVAAAVMIAAFYVLVPD